MITYTKMFEKIGSLPFETKHYVEKIDWESVQKTSTQRVDKHRTIRAHDLNDSFGRNVRYYCENDLNLKIYQANITMVPPGSLTPMHTDKYEYIRTTHKLPLSKTDHDKVFVKYWIPLSDRTIGHWFEYNGVLIGDWKANDVYRIFGSSTFEHCAGNLGLENRVRLEIIGSQLSAEKIHQIFA